MKGKIQHILHEMHLYIFWVDSSCLSQLIPSSTALFFVLKCKNILFSMLYKLFKNLSAKLNMLMHIKLKLRLEGNSPDCRPTEDADLIRKNSSSKQYQIYSETGRESLDHRPVVLCVSGKLTLHKQTTLLKEFKSLFLL